MKTIKAFKKEEFFKVQDGIAPDRIMYVGTAAVDVREYGITIEAYNDSIDAITNDSVIPDDLYLMILKN